MLIFLLNLPLADNWAIRDGAKRAHSQGERLFARVVFFLPLKITEHIKINHAKLF